MREDERDRLLHQKLEASILARLSVSGRDPRDVAASETRHRNATYHFIVRGAPA